MNSKLMKVSVHVRKNFYPKLYDFFLNYYPIIITHKKKDYLWAKDVCANIIAFRAKFMRSIY